MNRSVFWVVAVLMVLVSVNGAVAAWYNNTEPLYEFELSPQNQSYTGFLNATLGTVTNTTGIVGGSAMQCAVASSVCGFNVSNSGYLNPTATQSIGFWYKGTGTSGYIMRKGKSPNVQFYAYIGANGTIEFGWSNDGTGQANTGAAITDGTEKCVVLINNGTHEYAVINNATDLPSKKTVSGAITTYTDPLTWFSNEGSSPNAFIVDEVFYANRSLNTTDIQSFCSKTSTSAPTPPTVNVITLSLSNLVNGSSWPSTVTFSNKTGTLDFAFFNITGTGFCVTLTGNGTSTNCTTSGSGSSTFFNVSNNSVSVTGTQGVSAGTYQALLNVSAYRLFLNTSIPTYNTTNGVFKNASGTLVYALNGSNNVQIDVAGNYSKNDTCTVSTPLTDVACNVTGIYDDLFTIGASYGGTSIAGFNISVENATLGGVLYNQSTTNGSLAFALLQGYTYLFNFRAVNYTSQNVTLPANASTNLYNFTAFLSREIRVIFRDEITRELINSTNMTLEIISDIYADNVSTTNGTIVEVLLFPTEYLFRYRGGTYTERQYFLNVTDDTNTNLTLYVIDLNESDLVMVTITDTGGNIIEGATAKVLRYFLYCNCYEIVEMERSGPDGTTNFWVQPIEGHYKWSIDYSGSNYFLSSSPETITTTEKFFSIDLGQNYYASYRALSSIGTVITVNATTGAIAYSWSDPTGIVTEGCLTTYRFIGVIETQTNQSCASGTTGGVVIVINTTDNRLYKYVASLDTSAAYSDHIVYTGYFDPDFEIDFGVTGQYLAMVLVVILAIVFSFSAAAVLISVSISLVIVSALGLITFTTGFIAGVAALFAGLAIFLLRS